MPYDEWTKGVRLALLDHKNSGASTICVVSSTLIILHLGYKGDALLIGQAQGVEYYSILSAFHLEYEGGKREQTRRVVSVSVLEQPSGLGRKQGWWLWADNCCLDLQG